MNILIVFSKALTLPVENNKSVKTYGLVLNKDRWEATLYKEAFLNYIRVVELMYKDGFISNGGIKFVKNGELTVYYGDLTWRCFETVVLICGVQYAIVGDCNELDKGDYQDDLFTNKDKWEEITKRKGLVWQR